MPRKWWLPALALLGVLLLKAWLVAGLVVGEARTLAAEAADIDEARVEMVDGLDVRLTGFADEASRDRAVAAVDELDSSWDVEGILADDAGDTGESTTPTTDTTDTDTDTTDTSAADGAGDLVASVVTMTASPGGGVVLTGTVASDDVRSALVAQAATDFGADNVDDQLVVDGEAVSPAGGELVLQGDAGSEGQRTDWVDGAAAVAAEAGLELRAEVEVVAVEEQLNALFELEPIEFDTSEATIRPDSSATLDEAAAVLNANPEVGKLRVVGHTDTDGRFAANQALSERRAEAVVGYLVTTGGVDPDRLEFEGRGQRQLEVDPEVTPEDKQRNRRIEWELINR